MMDKPVSPLSAQDIAEKSSAIMMTKDIAARTLGMVLSDVKPGGCTMTMKVQPTHLNGHGICHGGYIFTLADTAFAFACNSYNQLAVAQHNTISFVAPGKPDETLKAVAVESYRSGRSGIYDVTVTGEDGRMIAQFRGCSRTIKGTHFDMNEDET